MTDSNNVKYELDNITKHQDEPTIITIDMTKREVATELRKLRNRQPESARQGHAYIIWNDAEWLTKKGVTTAVPIPALPPTYSGNTHALLEAYKMSVLLYNDHTDAMVAAETMIFRAFPISHFLELMDDENEVVGYTPRELIQHLEDT